MVLSAGEDATDRFTMIFLALEAGEQTVVPTNLSVA